MLGADILIDDHIAHAEDVAAAGLKAIVFGDYPWNQKEMLPEGMVRCADWTSVEGEIARYGA